MNKNKITLEEVFNIIDRHIENETELMFICDYRLAKEISEYCEEVYGIIDETSELHRVVKDYYVIITSDGELICEVGKGISGNYKLDDHDDKQCDYFIFNDMTEKECNDKLLSELGTWSWNELVEDNSDDDNDEEDCCPFCENIHNILEQISESEFYEEDFEILHSAFSDCMEQCYNQGYTEALRNQSKIMNEIADKLTNTCDCEECDCGCED